ncbi:hypothetical protein T492DRAFT_838593 [Pavlovales sp. CCMP2436]|nr:hypothetical protein T492DRAFT_838593 [Pavlovales sp. CCMP2436]
MPAGVCSKGRRTAEKINPPVSSLPPFPVLLSLSLLMTGGGIGGGGLGGSKIECEPVTTGCALTVRPVLAATFAAMAGTYPEAVWKNTSNPTLTEAELTLSITQNANVSF